MMKKLLRIILSVIILLLLAFCIFLLFSTITEFRPPDADVLSTTGEAPPLPDSQVYSAMSWNLGYAGLGANMDFFYDGGTGVRDTRANVLKNYTAIRNFLIRNDSIDFILLQEIDVKSKRSYGFNQYEEIGGLLSHHRGELALNYKVNFVPVPPLDPMGKVKSGIATFSRFFPVTSIRYSFHGDFKWPLRSFELKRCYLANRYSVGNGKELILINTHNSAYDDGSLRAIQIKELSDYMLAEFQNGNYVLAGGDWNQCPSGFKPGYINFDKQNLSYLPDDFLKGWKQYYSDSIPTNRRVTEPYNKQSTSVTTIDFFIASPNIKVIDISIADLDFKNSDHHPVLINFMLK